MAWRERTAGEPVPAIVRLPLDPRARMTASNNWQISGAA